MLQLQTETETGPQLANLLRQPGSFAWWYVDLVDAQGRGMVLIWSFGLPFLPGARRCRPATERPSLSLALYENSRPSFYSLQQFKPEEVQIESPQCMRFGDSRFELVRRDGQVRLRAQLSMTVVGSGRIHGTVEAEGIACRAPAASSAAKEQHGQHGQQVSKHRWAPILAAQRGRAELHLEPSGRFELEGRAYIDSNGSPRPLHALGIDDWRWGRIALGDRELIYYLVEPEPGSQTAPIQHVLEARADGTLRALPVEVSFSDPRRSLYGLAYHQRARLTGPELDLHLRFRALVDDGPFYLRFLVDAEERSSSQQGYGAQQGCGVAEQVAPGRVDLAWQRPFVRMRTQQTAGPNSIWLPLFSGPQKGRLGRLARHWTGGSSAAVCGVEGELR